MATIRELMTQYGGISWIVFARHHELGGYGPDDELMEDDEQRVRDHYEGDPTPYEQYRAVDGAPDSPWGDDI